MNVSTRVGAPRHPFHEPPNDTQALRVACRLGDMLVEHGLVGREQVETAATEALATRRALGDVLVERGKITERDLYRVLAEQAGIDFADQRTLLADADPALAAQVPSRFLEKHHVLPIVKLGTTLRVAVVNPATRVPELGRALGADDVSYVVVTPTDFRRLRMAATLGMVGEPSEGASADRPAVRDICDPNDQIETEHVAVVDAMLLEAIAERASDIHLERYGDRVRFRLRIDGDLHDFPRFSVGPDQYQGLVNVIKIKANLDIAEHRIPQGGRCTASAAGRRYDLRVQTQPTLYGEHVVIRLLSKEMELVCIEQLGLPPSLARTYGRLLESPSGLILVVGPTGSGKSTTLYAGLHVLAKDATRKVITVEDPIECAIDGIQQTQVRSDLCFTFASAMRAFVREDPDVILIGEIRDGETALEALRASQTGHVVLSTLHCNDSVDAVQRLFDLGAHPNSVASELIAVFAQRLAKRICGSCREEIEPPADLCEEVFPEGMPDGFRSFHGTGCPHCSGYGSFGRIAVVEYLPAGPSVRRAISRQLPLDELREVATGAGLVPMREHALNLVQSGTIAMEEMRAMFSPEQLAAPQCTAYR